MTETEQTVQPPKRGATADKAHSPFMLPRSPRMRQARIIFYVCFGLGALAGALLAIMDPASGQFSSAIFDPERTMSKPVAIGILVIATIALYLSARWHALLDEHERSAYDFGHVVALYAYFNISIVWWVLAKASLAPPPDGILIFLITFATMTIVWLVRRSR